MRRLPPSLLVVLAAVPAAVSARPSSTGGSDLRVALYADTMLAVGEWAELPGDTGVTMFGPSLGGELEVTLRLGRTLWGLVGKYGVYDTRGYVGTGEEPNRVEAAEARSVSVLAFTGLHLGEGGVVRTWGCLGLGCEWLTASETTGGREYDYGRVFQPSPCACLAFGVDFRLTEGLLLPLKASYDVSFGQVLGYGGYSGQGADLVLAAGLGVVF
jgi:hypothetical protein